MIEKSALASLLEARLVEWDKSRKGQETKLLECYQDVMRIPRDDDTAGTGTSKTRKTRSLFMGSTRNKVRSARAKIKDALFGNGEMPFDTAPTNEQLAPYADTVETIVTEQLTRMHFKSLLGNGVNSLATYGTAFMFGPFVRKEAKTETTADAKGELQDTRYEYDCPYFELGDTRDVYPDPEARTIEDGMGVFWVTMMSPHTIRAWKGQPGYKNIDNALLSPSDDGTETGSARSEQMRASVSYWHKNERIKVARYFGKIPKHSLSVWNAQTDVHDTTKIEDDQDLVEAIVIMAGGVVVKVDENPYGGRNPTLRCVYEEAEHEIWGVGPAENNGPHQKVTNAAFRLVMEGKGMALLGTATVDRSKFLPTEDFKKFPGKVYQTKPGLSPEERKDAIIFHVEPDITAGWFDIIKMSEGFSDDDTGITKYTQGDDSRNLNKTAHGISMIMSAASLPIKEVIEHIDTMWIEPMIEALIEWNIKFLEVETVQKIHGDEAARVWSEIKKFGKSSFMDWKATGTSSFMQKEVLVGKIRAFSEFALGNPVTAPLIDARELLNQTWNAMEVGKESPVLEDQGQGKVPPQVQQQMTQMQDMMQQMQRALQGAHAQVQQLEQEAKSRTQVEAMKAQAHSEREAAKQQHDRALEAMRLSSAEQIQHMKDATAHLTAEIAGYVTLLSKQIQPPPQVVAEAEKETDAV